MVSVSLYQLVQMEGSRALWPEYFQTMVTEMEANPGERTPFLTVADWLEEGDRGETELARAFRYLGKRPEIEIRKVNFYADKFYWEAKLIAPINDLEYNWECLTLAHYVAKVAGMLLKVMAAIS